MNRLRELILTDFSILPRELNRIISTAPHRYKVFYIPKKNKGQFREVAQPAQELKIIQNWLVGHISKILPVHSSAFAYISEKGIRKNAELHKNNRFVLKMDFDNFFPSVCQKDIEKHFHKYAGVNFTSSDIDDVCKIVLWSPPNRLGRHLCIGAPSSPFISNSILFDFDVVIESVCRCKDVTYTRYADDLIFSTNKENILHEIEHLVFKTLQEISYPSLTVNKEKTLYTSKGKGISITGVVVTPDRKLSIGRERKRIIRASIHHFINEKLSFDEVQKLNGLLAFAHDIEPDFVKAMKVKYGENILYKIKTFISQNQ